MSKSRRPRSAIGLALLLGSILPLAGCMGSGNGLGDALALPPSAAKRTPTAPLKEVAMAEAPMTASATALPAAPRADADLGEANLSAMLPDAAVRDPGRHAMTDQVASLADPVAPRQAPEATTPDVAVPVIDEQTARIDAVWARVKHGSCKGGWGPKPTQINAEQVKPGDSYYMEMRLRHTPPLPVGHVYIAYGRLGPDGKPVDEKLVMLAPLGGYAGATVAAAAPMPGVLEPYGDDCVIRPHAAYRRSLSPDQFEKLLLRVEQAKREKPRYALWTYNCNHFMSDIAAAAGILPPSNRYTPSLTYFYEMMDRNEGRKVPRSGSRFAKAG